MAKLAPRVELNYSIALLIFTASTGAIDAVSYLGLDRVFTGNMTGNVLFIGFGLVGMQGLNILNNFLAILAFMLGALLASRAVRGRGGNGQPVLARNAVTIMATASIVMFLLAAIWMYVPSIGSVFAVVITVILSMAAGAQASAVKPLGIDITTVVLTMTMVRLAGDSSLAGGNNQNWWQRLYALFAMFLGALIAAWFVLHVSAPAGLVASGVIITAGTILLAATRAAEARQLRG